MKHINKSTIIISLATLVGGLFIGWLIFSRPNTPEHSFALEEEEMAKVWTCSMHPSIRQNESGKCPICGMDLIPLSQDNEDVSTSEIKMSESAIKLANIQTTVAEQRTAVKQVRLTGKVQFDEMNVYSQTTHIAGRIESLSVNFTGEYVKKGQVLANIYSPELVTAQKELLEANKIKETQPDLFQAAREKLLNWKLTNRQIDRILEDGEIKEQVHIYADVSGVVVKKSVNHGDYLKKGAVLYQIADLSKLWVLFDIHESEIPWIHVGSEVTYTLTSIPGESFKGNINFIDPVINPETRVAKARISIRNNDLRLKPEMLVNGIIETSIAESSIIVPKSAVLWTGSRSIVYIKNQTASSISFQLREVELGPSLGESYIVKNGLTSGEEFVVNGAFSVDAAAQLAGKPSMMNPDGGISPSTHDHASTSVSTVEPSTAIEIPDDIKVSDEVKSQLSTLIDEYIGLKSSLANDDFELAVTSAQKYWTSYSNIKMSSFSGSAHTFWMSEGAPIEDLAKKIVNANDINEARGPFKPLSAHMVNLAKAFQPSNNILYVQYCPMADDFNGATWLSYEDKILNPYYGASMLTCGEVTDTISADNKTDEKAKPIVKSPHMEVMNNIGNNHIHIDYSSPRVRGRLIFGGLVAFDEVWATGAHKATSITFSKDVRINESHVKAGKYGLFTIPGKTSWVIILNSNWDQHLSDDYDMNDDILRFEVTPSEEHDSAEELIFSISPIDGESGVVKFQWAKTSFEFNINNN